MRTRWVSISLPRFDPGPRRSSGRYVLDLIERSDRAATRGTSLLGFVERRGCFAKNVVADSARLFDFRGCVNLVKHIVANFCFSPSLFRKITIHRCVVIYVNAITLVVSRFRNRVSDKPP